ncbi:MAG TPA: AlpA family phage regulatory protein [Bradyrhizobium sp.]
MAKSSKTYGAMPATGYMRQSQLIPAIFPFSSATLWRKVKEGTFPKPIKLAPRITAWRVEDIRELLYRGVWAESNHPSPARLGTPSLCTSAEVASRPTTNCDSNVPSLMLESGSENEGRQPQTDSADFASSRLSSGKVRAR